MIIKLKYIFYLLNIQIMLLLHIHNFNREMFMKCHMFSYCSVEGNIIKKNYNKWYKKLRKYYYYKIILELSNIDYIMSNII